MTIVKIRKHGSLLSLVGSLAAMPAMAANVVAGNRGSTIGYPYELAFQMRELRRSDLYTVSADGSRIATVVVARPDERQQSVRFLENGSPVDAQGAHILVSSVGDRPTRDHAPICGGKGNQWSPVWSPDGRRLASYAGNQCAYLWDAKTGEQIGPLLRHAREIDTIAFSPDGTLLLSVANTVLQVWETATGTLASPPMQHPDSIRRAWWKPDGTAIFTVDKRGLQREWNLAPGDRPAADLATLGHLYSSHRVTTGGALIPLGVEETQAAWEATKKTQDR